MWKGDSSRLQDGDQTDSEQEVLQMPQRPKSKGQASDGL